MVRVKDLLVYAALSLPLTSVARGDIFKPGQSSVQTKNKKVVIDENTIIFRGEVNTELVSKTMAKMYASTQEKIVLFIDSPGGSVTDGLYLFNFIANFNKPTICYVNNAASMAFVITQACTERYVTDSSIMMQHQASFGGSGTVNKMKELSRFGESLTTSANDLQAKRLGISVEAFEKRTMNDWWLFGAEAVKENAADGVVHMECKPELTKTTYSENVQVFIFQVKVTWSSCPLISYPLSVGMDGSKPGDEAKVKELLSDKTKYMKELNGR